MRDGEGKHRTLPSRFSINDMATKHYEAPDTIISNISLIVCGRPARISFQPISTYEGSHTGKGSMFVTDNAELQEAIERSPLFGRRIFLFKTEEPKPEVALDENGEEAHTVKVIPESEVGSFNDAREYLEKNHGYTKTNLPNRKAIINAAKAQDVEFEFAAEKE